MTPSLLVCSQARLRFIGSESAILRLVCKDVAYNISTGRKSMCPLLYDLSGHI
jgi:hypothetical protein